MSLVGYRLNSPSRLYIQHISILILAFLFPTLLCSQKKKAPLFISGVYPHLAVYNPGDSEIDCPTDGQESGIGAVVPWAGKLWMITYSPHCPNGSSDKLWTIDENLVLEMHPESIGGTPANRFIHTPSEQLIIGPYFIDKYGKVRKVPYSEMPGRHTAVASHLTDPKEMVYFQDMEGKMYEVNVNSLEVNKLFEKPVPGWHSKGAYTGQGRYVMSNNGEHKVFDINPDLLQAGTAPQNEDEMGCLAEWDGETWRIVDRRQYTEVTGPGGLYGNAKEDDPIWSFGWDRNSVLLKLLDGGKWYTFRLPKATNTYDHWGGWYTEWPRIREVGNGKRLMDAHGMFYDFPKHFSLSNYGGLFPISSHLRYIPDFCEWNGNLVLATDETATTGNPIPGRSMSNLWFGTWAQLKEWGPRNAYGAWWSNDQIKADQASEPFLINNFDQKILHLSHDNFAPVTFQIQIDREGNSNWENFHQISVPAKSYEFYIFPEALNASWVRIISDTDCRATAALHLKEANYKPDNPALFKGIAAANEAQSMQSGILRPAGHNLNLQYLSVENGQEVYYEIDQNLNFIKAPERISELKEILEFTAEFRADDASVIMERNGLKVRLPKGPAVYDQAFEAGWPRGIREVESERYLMNIHGTFYEMPREAGLNALRPVATHNKAIQDFCTWSGLLVLAGIHEKAAKDGHVFKAKNRKTGLWFGAIDDLWKLGKPRGNGGPWMNTYVRAGVASDPYLMTGYSPKSIQLSHNLPYQSIDIRLEVDVDHHSGWHLYKTIQVPPGKTIVHEFPKGYAAHWIRLIPDRNCIASGQLVYD